MKKKNGVENISKNVSFKSYKKRRFLSLSVIETVFLVVYDVLVMNFAYFLGLWLRYDFIFSNIKESYFTAFVKFSPFYTVISIVIFFAFKTYKSVWSFAGLSEILKLFVSNSITLIIHVVGITLFFRRMPVSYYIIGPIVQFTLMVGIRFAYRLLKYIRNFAKVRTYKDNAMIIGAGEAGQALAKEIYNSENLSSRVYCFIDDNEHKKAKYIDGIKIVGGRENILKAVQDYNINTIYLAIPSISNLDKSQILQICSETHCKIKLLPSFYGVSEKQVKITDLQDVSISDLLGREQIKQDMTDVLKFLTGKTILVTGGGGSIGSELCRQIARHNPEKLIIFDIYENNAYDIQLELKDKYPYLDLVTLIGSVRDSRRLESVFSQYKPDVVFHAAAHKHVPLMEDSPCEAIKNNAVGTYKTAFAAMQNGCKRFVLISTDKAVNPTNIMGASKRLCEMIIQTFDRKIKDGSADEISRLFTHFSDDYFVPKNVVENPVTEFVAVRFGNVLGSNGSVVPLFKRQIAKGGPITVTHPDIIRYFMTIPEAVSLVLQAGVNAKGGEIFVLDMGEPMKITDLAKNLIKLSGLTPDVDIKIEYTGLRPGEKLFEEKLMLEEGLKKTENDLIHIGSPIPFDADDFLKDLKKLMKICYSNDEEATRKKIAEVVKTYHSPSTEKPKAHA